MKPLGRVVAGLRRRLLRWSGIEPLRLDTDRYVADVGVMQLPASTSLRREPPRPPEHRQPGYMSEYDGVSVFYDVFWNGHELVFIGPPLRNLARQVLPALRFDGRPAPAPTRRHQFNRVDVTAFSVPRPRRIDLSIDGAHLAARVSDDGASSFAGTRALITLSKDNDLVWIEDWLDFYVRAHGVDAVVVYDNSSTRYSAGELLRRIAAVPGIRVAVVVAWPFNFGPLTDPTRTYWDSDFCQYVMLEHARRRFVRDAAVVFQVDIDELVVAPAGQDLPDLVAQSQTGAIVFPGRWMRYVAAQSPVPARRHRNHRHYIDDGNAAADKWVAVPARIPDDVQMALHSLIGAFEPNRVEGVLHRHFRAVSTGWKFDRSQPEAFDPQVHLVDEEWLAQMHRIGWSSE